MASEAGSSENVLDVESVIYGYDSRFPANSQVPRTVSLPWVSLLTPGSPAHPHQQQQQQEEEQEKQEDKVDGDGGLVLEVVVSSVMGFLTVQEVLTGLAGSAAYRKVVHHLEGLRKQSPLPSGGACESPTASYEKSPLHEQNQQEKQQRQQQRRLRRARHVTLSCDPWVCAGPDISWSRRLNSLEKLFVELSTANAVLSTLGGGYFCCRQTAQAIHIAATQAILAGQMGDEQARSKHVLNTAYSLIWLGRYRAARAIIRAEKRNREAAGDADLARSAAIALLFLKRTKRANRQLREPVMKQRYRGASITRDDYFRVRMLKQPQLLEQAQH